MQIRGFHGAPAHLAASLPLRLMLWRPSGDQHSRVAAPTILPRRQLATPPQQQRGKMTTPERWDRSNGKAVASWRDSNSEDRENSIRKDIAARLKCSCSGLSIVEFQALVIKMTSEQLRGERALHGWTPQN